MRVLVGGTVGRAALRHDRVGAGTASAKVHSPHSSLATTRGSATPSSQQVISLRGKSGERRITEAESQNAEINNSKSKLYIFHE